MYVYVFMYCVYECMYVCAQSWDLSKDFLAHDDYLLRCVISPHGRTIATTSADKTVKLWYVKGCLYVCMCMYVCVCMYGYLAAINILFLSFEINISECMYVCRNYSLADSVSQAHSLSSSPIRYTKVT